MEDEVFHDENSASSGFDFLLGALKKIDGVNVDLALNRFSGITEIYIDTVRYTVKKLKSNCEIMSGFLADGNIKSFEISVHTLKSSLAQAGIIELSKTAAKFETSARNEDFDFCQKEFPAFKEKLIKLYEEMTAVFLAAESLAGKDSGVK
ncbi:MAG: Hpt domain-containing protein [Treponema sp.]|jgi:HPt (histidine-containing phosphotransfer) domain-containing protein|nr:Hpt domain-containing protein [Treponema sp.]